MPRRLWLSLAMLAVGGGLLVTSALAGPSLRQGGVFRVGISGASVQVDPQLAYITTAWWLEYATAVKLYNWPDRPGLLGNRLVAEAAASFTVSNHGKKYTFFIRPGLRFSDGTPVTAKSFKYALDRVANHDLQSPGVQFITDPNGTNIVGAKAVNDGKAQHISGVTAKGNRLIIRLTKPDSSFLTKLTMPFFQATSTKLPLTHEVTGAYPSAGPYRFTRNDVNVLTSIRRNPYYRGLRPNNLTGVDVQWNFRQTPDNPPDESFPSPDQIPGLVAKYGVNKSRFWAKPVNCVGWLLFNNKHGLFKNNIAMRKAVNWAVDRKAYAAQAGPYAGFPWTHLLPPGSPGSIGARKLQPYWPSPNLTKARKLAKGHFKDGKVTVAYWTTGTINPAQAQVVRHSLIQLGFKPENITMRGYYCEIGPCGGTWDIIANGGWCTDYPDPYDLLRTFFITNPSFDYPSLASARYAAKLKAAARLVGNARFRAFGKLDLEIMNTLAPVAVMRTYNNRYFFSNRVDPRGLSYQAVYSDWSIPALALK